MEQNWNAFWQSVETGAHHVLSPFRIAAEILFGVSPPDIQIWVFLVAVFMFAIAVPRTYGDIVLMRRRAYAIGKVTGIDVGDEAPDTPIIDFRDASGKLWTFESELGCNDLTGRIGAAVPVIYDPQNPRRAREDGRLLSKIWRAVMWYTLATGLLVIGSWPGLLS